MSILKFPDREKKAPGNNDVEGGVVIDATDIFRQAGAISSKTNSPQKVPSNTTPATSEQDEEEDDEVIIKPENYKYLSENIGLMNRVTRVYASHVVQIRNGVRQATTFMVRHDDPATLRADVRRLITDLDSRAGKPLGFGKDIAIVGGTSSSNGSESDNVEKHIGPNELRQLVTRLEREINCNAALRDEDEAAYSIRRSDYGRTARENVMNKVNNAEPSLALRLFGWLRIRGRDEKSIPQYLADKLAITITRARKK